MNKYERRRLNLMILKDEFCDGKVVSLAEKLGKSSSYVSRLLYEEGRENKKNIADRAIADIEKAFSLPEGYLDNFVDMAKLNKDVNVTRSKISRSYKVEILDISANVGVGMVNTDVIDVVRSIEYNKLEAQKLFNGKNNNNIKVINIKGDSMKGVFEPGDLAFVDVSVNSFEGDGIYVFVYDKSLFVKRLQLIKNKLLVISENRSYRDWEITEAEQNNLFIKGKIILSQSMHIRQHA